VQVTLVIDGLTGSLLVLIITLEDVATTVADLAIPIFVRIHDAYLSAINRPST
jgi:hypothetical protein